MLKNYYKVLGVDVLSPPEDIKRAYRKLAKEYHPDMNPDNPDAQQMFQDVKDAYDVLSCPEERLKYDRQLKYLVVDDENVVHNHTSQKISKLQIKDIVRKITIIISSIIIMVGIIILLIPSMLNNKGDTLQPDLIVEEVISIYGEPDEMTKTCLKYSTGIIMLENDCVVGWYDVDNIFKIKNKQINDINDITVGQSLDTLFQQYGYPDTYAKTFVTYDDIVIIYKDNKIVEVIDILQ